ncbi:MAG: carboxypeptidase regulatory-like domain-containing protein [Acidobacteria bacterium]|nr:carboxypeptidase regulatory-like domain-containing protein [Acidobacteriota bacterium]
MRTTIGVKLIGFVLLLQMASAAEDPAVVAGTVFRDPGFALPQAEVVLTVKAAPQGAKVPKSQKYTTNQRGEFMFHVPPVKAEYLLTAKSKGFAAEEKVAVVSGGPERVDVYFMLKPLQ